MVQQAATRIKWMTDQEINRLTLALETEENEFNKSRDQAIFYTMFRAGLLIEEVSDLRKVIEAVR